ncbi:uncharacterized protein LOC129738950 [Uranotaenia lowii]|uniref:uncharacterized protein LOC129738950 n=1 Tax=Uranotaenia lowii TaxID=190385 RepID=UPI002478AFB0|nr:uncharacterized protein LOC129738950 [Uranotaenia lowii]XP_055586256.1 uncharacterized protein LOC129738950 [Uranotaenia lowii]
MEKKILTEKVYPTSTEQHNLAVRILQVFPELEKFRVAPHAPAESIFFWKNNGQDKGPHSGLIFNKIRNTIAKLPSEEKKYRKKTPTKTGVPTEIVRIADDIQHIDPTLENKKRIKDAMVVCYPLLHALLEEKKTMQEILEVFPHFTEFRGYLIRHVFFCKTSGGAQAR